MPSGFAHYSCANVPALTAAISLGLVIVAGASCGGSVSTAGTDGALPEGSTSGGSTGSASGGGSLDGSTSEDASGSASGEGSLEGSTSDGVSGSGPGGGSPEGSTSDGLSSGMCPDFPPPMQPLPVPVRSPCAGIGPGCGPSLNGNSGVATFGQGKCTLGFGETCGGIDYTATCACPQGTCVCFGPSSTQVVSFTDCPSCPGPAQVYKLCGYPYDASRMW
jgi:hypothetical protein